MTPMSESGDLDLSIYHPLDHRPFDARCRGFHGGGRRHVALWWEYQFRYTPAKVWHRCLLCRIGRHRIVEGTDVTIAGVVRSTQTWCPWCGYVPPRNDSR